jgi:predicted alpha/beta-fold hydrolase
MFKPSSYRPRFTGGHKQTLYAWARPRRFPRLPVPVERYFDVAADARVLAHCHFRGENVGTAPTLVLLHGLEGSSMAHYMRGIADKAWAAGWDVVRLNQRNCGGTERLSRGLYHSGLTHDVRHVVYELLERDGVPAVAVSGYSLGGNLALKLAGELADAVPPGLVGVCAVSPAMDLAICVEALERRSNYPYEWNFVRNLKARMRRKSAAFPGAFSLDPLRRIWTVRQFDDAYTAPHHGFADAADYYYRASVRSDINLPGCGGGLESQYHAADHAARWTLCVCRTWRWRLRRLLGGARDCALHRLSGHESPRCCISSFANSGPFPSSSCLK